MTGEDIHPPCYLPMDEFIHATGGKQNLWQGLGLNIACNLLTLLLPFLITRRLFPAFCFPVPGTWPGSGSQDGTDRDDTS